MIEKKVSTVYVKFRLFFLLSTSLGMKTRSLSAKMFCLLTSHSIEHILISSIINIKLNFHTDPIKKIRIKNSQLRFLEKRNMALPIRMHLNMCELKIMYTRLLKFLKISHQFLMCIYTRRVNH